MLNSSNVVMKFWTTLYKEKFPLTPSQITSDIAAGLSLVAIAIPQALAHTNIAGTPVITGLYTILIPPILFALFGSSRHLIVGADSATAAVMASGLLSIAALCTSICSICELTCLDHRDFAPHSTPLSISGSYPIFFLVRYWWVS